MKAIKNNFIEISKYKLNVQGKIFCVYFYIVTALSIFLSGISFKFPYCDFVVLALCILCLAIVIFITKLVFKYSYKLKVSTSGNKTSKSKLKFLIISFVILLACYLLWYAVFFPGLFTSDAQTQLRDVLNNYYRDWHPFFQTFLCLDLPYKLINDIYLIAPIQFVIFACVWSFMIETIYEITNRKLAIVCFIYILINPNFNCLAIAPLKDASFCIVCIVLYTCIGRFWIKKSKTKYRILYAVAIGICLCLTVCFRHNGILVAIPLLIVCIILFDKKMIILTLTLFISLTLIVQFPIASALNVERQKFDDRPEIYGLACAVFETCYKTQADKVDDDIKYHFFNIYDKEHWDNRPEIATSNSIIWGPPKNKYQDIDLLKTYSYVTELFLTQPKESMYAICSVLLYPFLYATSSYTSNIVCWINLPNVESFNLGAKTYNMGGNEMMHFIFRKATAISSWPFSILGLYSLLCLYLLLAKCNLSNKKGWFKGLLIVSFFTYIFGTLPFLPMHELRYFIFIPAVLPLVAILMCLINPKTDQAQVQHL